MWACDKSGIFLLYSRSTQKPFLYICLKTKENFPIFVAMVDAIILSSPALTLPVFSFFWRSHAVTLQHTLCAFHTLSCSFHVNLLNHTKLPFYNKLEAILLVEHMIWHNFKLNRKPPHPHKKKGWPQYIYTVFEELFHFNIRISLWITSNIVSIYIVWGVRL